MPESEWCPGIGVQVFPTFDLERKCTTLGGGVGGTVNKINGAQMSLGPNFTFHS